RLRTSHRCIQSLGRMTQRAAPRILAVMACVLVLFAPLLLAAREKARKPAEPPKLGLVLSGGGARGAAHLGVLQVLEEMRIPVDMVTGTRMGSIVAGLYAGGASPSGSS